MRKLIFFDVFDERNNINSATATTATKVVVVGGGGDGGGGMGRAFTEHGLLALLIVKVGAVQSAWGELSQNMAFLPCSW